VPGTDPMPGQSPPSQRHPPSIKLHKKREARSFPFWCSTTHQLTDGRYQPGSAARRLAAAAACARVARGPAGPSWRRLPGLRAAWQDRSQPGSGRPSRGSRSGQLQELVLELVQQPLALAQQLAQEPEPLEQEPQQLAQVRQPLPEQTAKPAPPQPVLLLALQLPATVLVLRPGSLARRGQSLAPMASALPQQAPVRRLAPHIPTLVLARLQPLPGLRQPLELQPRLALLQRRLQRQPLLQQPELLPLRQLPARR
jgi:hypothetical protein